MRFAIYGGLALLIAVTTFADESPQVQLKARVLQLEAMLAQKNLEAAACQMQLSTLLRPAEQQKIEKEAGCANGFDWQALKCKVE